MTASPIFLYLIIIIEGYIVLSSELLAIRQTVAFVGSGTDTVSIIIAAVLMPLAIGYYNGGYYRAKLSAQNASYSIRKKLTKNLFISSVFLLIGLSTWTVDLFFFNLSKIGIEHRLISITIYSLLFLAPPVYLLGQTVPLISNYFSKQKLSKITGKMLFFSTLGSFLGSIFSTLILMSYIGVHNTVTFTFVLIFIISFILSHKKRDRQQNLLLLTLTVFAALLNSGTFIKGMHIVSDNQYNTIKVLTDSRNITHFIQDNNDSSTIGPDNYKHSYIKAMETIFIDPLKYSEAPPKKILVIGAGGFTFGLSDTVNQYTYIDIDPRLEEIATTYFLKEKLTANKKFAPLPAQNFLISDKGSYDLIFLDAFNGDVTLPEDLVTLDFFLSVRKKLAPDGILAANFILSPTFKSPMSTHLENTLRQAFPYVTRQIVQDYNAWEQNPNIRQNILYICYTAENDGIIYTRDKNRIFFDKPYKRQ